MGKCTCEYLMFKDINANTYYVYVYEYAHDFGEGLQQTYRRSLNQTSIL